MVCEINLINKSSTFKLIKEKFNNIKNIKQDINSLCSRIKYIYDNVSAINKKSNNLMKKINELYLTLETSCQTMYKYFASSHRIKEKNYKKFIYPIYKICTVTDNDITEAVIDLHACINNIKSYNKELEIIIKQLKLLIDDIVNDNNIIYDIYLNITDWNFYLSNLLSDYIDDIMNTDYQNQYLSELANNINYHVGSINNILTTCNSIYSKLIKFERNINITRTKFVSYHSSIKYSIKS